jgi:hypothetical protein
MLPLTPYFGLVSYVNMQPVSLPLLKVFTVQVLLGMFSIKIY